MLNCELAETCVFLNEQVAGMPSTSAVYMKIYCEQDFDNCGRYMVFNAIGRENVPNDLFPNQSDRAKEVIAAHKQPIMFI